MPRFLVLLLVILGGLGCSAWGATPDRIRYDNPCFIIDGKDTFLYSGSFHYFRCPKPLWAERFRKMKEAGLNCVETYVAWNWHERQPPASLDDFSKMDMTDLTDWLDMAINQFGFYVILRPGPYICAEWDGGGYPQWLVTKKPRDAKRNWLRGDEPVYLAWCKHWYSAAAKAAVPFQITHRPAGRGGVILWQIENEYNYADFPAEVKLHQLLALAHDSRDAGIDVPLITCMTDDPLYRADPFLLQNVIECRNAYPNFDPRGELRNILPLDKYQPEKPKMMTELQGGWFSDVGNKLSDRMGFTPQQITHVTLLAWAYGYTGTNYYMMFGGTNLGDWGAAMKTTTYDYAAPIREWGGVGPRYFAVRAMANFLKEHGLQLARSSQTDEPDDGDLSDVRAVIRRGADGSRFVFIFNHERNDRVNGTLHLATSDIKGSLHYQLDPFDAKILYLPADQTDPSKGQWYPQPVSPPQRPTDLPDDVTIIDVRRQVDPGPAADSWRDLPDGASIEDVGIFDRRYVFYRSDAFGTTPSRTTLTARLAAQDSFIAQLNGARLDVRRHGPEIAAASWPGQSNGENRLLLLYENGGRDNGGPGIDATCGLHDLTVTTGPNAIALHWQISGQTVGTAGHWQDPKLDDSDWEAAKMPEQVASAANTSPPNLVWYRLHFQLPSPDPHVWVPWKLHLEATGNGFIYLNGYALGRYWHVGPQQDFYLPECWLNFGPGSSNVVTLCLRPTTRPPEVGGALVLPYRDFAETRQ